MERSEKTWCRSSTLLRRAAAFAVLMLAAQTALWAYTVTLKAGRGTGSDIVLDSEDKANWADARMLLAPPMEKTAQ